MTRGIIAFHAQKDRICYMSRNNLTKWRTDAGMSRKCLAEKLDLSLASLSRIESGKQQPREDLIELILKIFQKKRPEFYDDGSNVSPVSEGIVRVPIIDYSQAVLFAGENAPDLLGDQLQKFILTNGDHSGMAFALRIKGDSMLPKFEEGDMILIDPAVTPGPGDYVIARKKGGDVTFRKYRAAGINDSGQDLFELVPLNDDYATVRSDATEVEIIGTMLSHTTYRKS